MWKCVSGPQTGVHLNLVSEYSVTCLGSTYNYTLLVSTCVSEYSWIVSTPCSVPTSCNTIESTLDSKYL